MAVVEEKRRGADQMMYSLVALSKAEGSIAFIRGALWKDLDAVQTQTDSIMFGQRVERSAEPPRRNERKSDHRRSARLLDRVLTVWCCSIGILQQIIQNRAKISPKNPPSAQQQLTRSLLQTESPRQLSRSFP
jgi:hypothetical protein